MILLLIAAGLSGIAMALFAISEWPWILFGFFGLVPWLAALERVKTKTGALLAALPMSVAYAIGHCYWLPGILQSFSGLPWSVSIVVLLLAAPLIQPQFLAYALVRQIAANGKAIWLIPAAPLAGAFAYVGVDWLFPKLFADTLGHMLFGAVLLRQSADVFGALGLTFLVLLANECILAILKNLFSNSRPRTIRKVLAPTACLIILVTVPLGYGAVRLHQFTAVDETEPPFNYGLVQAGFSHFASTAEYFGEYLTVRTVLDTHIALSREAMAGREMDLLVWPENMYPLTFGTPMDEQGARFDQRIGELVSRTGIPLVFGARDIEDESWYNAAFFVTPLEDDHIGVQAYRKAFLFPFIEYTPGFLDHDSVRQRMAWLGAFTPGPGPRVVDLDLPNGRSLGVVPLICYDALQPGHVIKAVRQGGEVLVTLSNDSWFEHGYTPRIILNISAFRSIETRRPQLRATVTGISAVITPTGEIIDRLDTGEHGVLVGSIQPRSGTTLMLVLGDWFGPTALVGALLILAICASTRRRNSAP